MRMYRFLMAMLLAGMALAQGPAAGKQEAAPRQAPSFDLKALDTTPDPCANFYRYACGGWMKNNPIPSDQASWGRFNELFERNRAFLRDILEEAASATNRTPNQQKIGDYYASCIDEEAINKKGVAALKPAFDRVNSIKDKSELTGLIAHMHAHGIDVLLNLDSGRFQERQRSD